MSRIEELNRALNSIIAAANGWLMVTDAQAYLSALWMRFIPHFGVDEMGVKFIDWVETLSCGVDLMGDFYPIPA